MRWLLGGLFALAATAALAQFNRCGPGFCPGGVAPGFKQPGGTVTPLTNLRITNTGDFRITNTADNRAVFP
jgi:hypothetical protein